MRSLKFLTILGLVWLSSCSDKDKLPKGEILNIKAYEPSTYDSLLFGASRKIKLENDSTGMSYLKKINRIASDSGKLFIFDAELRKIVIYNEEGKFLSYIKNTGYGPREYQQVSDFFLDKDRKQILLLCNRPYKVIFYDYNGKFLKETILEDAYGELAGDLNNYYFRNFHSRNNILKDYHIDVYDKDFKQPNSILELDKSIKNRAEFSGNSITSGTSLLFSQMYDNNIYQLANGSAKIKYSVNFRNNSLPEEFKNSVPEKAFELYKKALITGIKDVKETKANIFFNTNIGLFHYSKQSKELIGYRSVLSSEYSISLIRYLTMGGTADEIVYVIEPVQLLKLRDIGIEKNLKLNPNFLKLISKMTENDNPLLFIYKVK